MLNGAAGSEWVEYMPNEPRQLILEIVIPILFFSMMLLGRHRESLSMYLLGTLPALFMLCIWSLYIQQMAHGSSHCVDSHIATALWLLLSIALIYQQQTQTSHGSVA